MIPLFLVCPVRWKAVYCRELLSFKYRYDFVKDVLFYIFGRAGIYVKKEAPINN